MDHLAIDAANYPIHTYFIYAVLIGLASYNYKTTQEVFWSDQSPGELLHAAFWLVVLGVSGAGFQREVLV